MYTHCKRLENVDLLQQVRYVEFVLRLDGRQKRFVCLEVLYQVLKHLSVSLSRDLMVSSRDQSCDTCSLSS